jgi:DNA-binding response OmpR family regulator
MDLEPPAVPARILVVEDEPHIRDLVALHLGLEGLQPVPVGDGQEALRLARTEPFDLIVLDLMLPGSTGSRSAARFAGSSSTATCPS